MFDRTTVAASLFYVIEVARLETQLTQRYPGLKRFRELRREYVASKLQNIDGKVNQTILEIKSHLAGFSDMGSPWNQILEEVITEDSDVYSNAKATTLCSMEIFSDLEQEYFEEDHSANRESLDLAALQRLERLDTWESELRGTKALVEAAETIAVTDGSQNDTADEVDFGEIRNPDIQALARQRDQLARKIDIERSNLGFHYPHAVQHVRQFRYDEWDYLNNNWKKGWCILYEITSHSTPSDESQQLLKSIKPLVRRVRQKFEQLRPSGMRRINKMISTAMSSILQAS